MGPQLYPPNQKKRIQRLGWLGHQTKLEYAYRSTPNICRASFSRASDWSKALRNIKHFLKQLS
jgi:hypothetical protein